MNKFYILIKGVFSRSFLVCTLKRKVCKRNFNNRFEQILYSHQRSGFPLLFSLHFEKKSRQKKLQQPVCAKFILSSKEQVFRSFLVCTLKRKARKRNFSNRFVRNLYFHQRSRYSAPFYMSQFSKAKPSSHPHITAGAKALQIYYTPV